ncbi:LFG4 protein, partial [Polyodon spathula]|nr:LFG4 protein [Polyodon spathula]
METEKYPRSSIEDDFNYGTNVATASVQIRMGQSKFCCFVIQHNATDVSSLVARILNVHFCTISRLQSCFREFGNFLRKVYSILSIQIILTTVTSAVFMYSDSIKNFVHASPALVLISAVGSLGLIFALAIYRHQHPVNLYLLLGFTLFEAVTVATAVTFYEYSVVLQAFALTAAVFVGLTAYTFQSRRDFSKLGAGLFACLWILIIASFMRLFFHNETVELVLAGAGALVFCGFIIFDTHLLMHKLSPEEYILASINLYLDIINLFLHLLRLLEAMKRN